MDKNYKKLLDLIGVGKEILNKLEKIAYEKYKVAVLYNIENIFGRGSTFVQKAEQLFYDGSDEYSARVSLESIISLLELYLDDIPKEKITKKKVVKEKQEFDKTKVFIVHGHDDQVKTEVENLLRRLDVEPIILHQQTSSSDTIIEKIERYSDVGFGIVLYTPCDVGNTKDKKDELNFRARQNVVFEHGFLIGKIGRKNVCALKKENLETPGDIGGIVYTTMDPYGAWKMQLAKEMKSSGYAIDMNKL